MRLICCFFFIFFLSSLHAQINKKESDWMKAVGARTKITSRKIFWVNDFGAHRDDTTVSTVAIQRAIDACSSEGGGIVCFKTGKYRMGSIFLKNNVNLKIDKDVFIEGSQDFSDYPEIDT